MAQIFLPVGSALVSKGDLHATDPMWGWMRQITAAVGGSGGGAVAPADAKYVTWGADATLTNERVATSSATITVNTGTVGQIKWDAVNTSPVVAGTVVTLTNAQFKSLPTTAITVIPALGANQRVAAFWIDLEANFTAGAYTNRDVDGYLALKFSSGGEVSNYIANDSAIPLTYLNDFTAAVQSRALLQNYCVSEPVNLWGNLSAVEGYAINTAIQIFISNGGSGDLTGGNAANTVRVTPYYIPMATF